MEIAMLVQMSDILFRHTRSSVFCSVATVTPVAHWLSAGRIVECDVDVV